MKRIRVAFILPGAVVVSLAVWAVMRAEQGPLDLATPPRTIIATVPLDVGATYTLGSIVIPDEVPRPVTVTSVEVIARSGVDVVGVAGGGLGDVGVGLIATWPPPTGIYVDPLEPGMTYAGRVEIVVGLRVTAPRSGMRGIVVRWIDAAGTRGSRAYDIATATCSAGTCSVPEDEASLDGFLRDLGLAK